MKLITIAKSLEHISCDVIAIPVIHDATIQLKKSLPNELKPLLKEALNSSEFCSRPGNTYHIRVATGTQIIFTNLGDKKYYSPIELRTGLSQCFDSISEVAIPRVYLHLYKDLLTDKIDSLLLVQVLAEAAVLGTYSFTKYKASKVKSFLPKQVLLSSEIFGKINASEIRNRFTLGHILAEATCEARDLINEPANFLTPEDMATIARSYKSPNLSVKILNEKQIQAKGMGGLWAVGKGSENPPRCILFHYKPKGKIKKRIALVGKGITFDTGGISLKPGLNMHEMKGDMGGSAAVLGAFSVISKLAPKHIEIKGYIASAENMPSRNAVKPGDVITMHNGKTVEIMNTDAEGRLVLADMLSLASKEHNDEIIDLATLTGACVVALGTEITGGMTNNQQLFDRVQKSSIRAGERLWQLPLPYTYRRQMKSLVADTRNIGSRWGGTLIAGLFLEYFVDESIPWLHLDIAGPSYDEAGYEYNPKGGAGVMVRTLLEYILDADKN